MNKRLFKVFSLITILALILMAVPMQSGGAVSNDIVISQVYGGGGNSGAPYKNDFVELFNRSTAPVSLNGWSIQYASATGTGNFGSNPIASVTGTLQPGQYYLVQLAGGANGVALPTPDATGTANMSGTGGKVALVMGTAGLACNGGSTPCSSAQLALIKDLVGWDGANFYETAAAPATTNFTAALRLANGCTETDNNASDIAAGAPTPRNTASTLNPCAAADTAPEVTSTYPTNGATDFPKRRNSIRFILWAFWPFRPTLNTWPPGQIQIWNKLRTATRQAINTRNTPTARIQIKSHSFGSAKITPMSLPHRRCQATRHLQGNTAIPRPRQANSCRHDLRRALGTSICPAKS